MSAPPLPVAPGARAAFVAALRGALGPEVVTTDEGAIDKILKDNSWLSPILTDYFQGAGAGSGLPGLDALVAPRDEDELRQAIALAVRYGVPITPRGAGSSNFGQSIPLEGGMLLDLRRFDRILAVSDTQMTAQAGTLHGAMDRAARERGRDVTLLTTTYQTATIGGWIAGGHVGVGTNAYGSIWDGNVLALKLLTAEDPPRTLNLAGDAAYPALHTYGTVGIIAEVTVPLVPAREWVEQVVAFDRFDAAARYVLALAAEPHEAQRVIIAVEWPMPSGFTPLRGLFAEGQSAVLMMLDAAVAERHAALARKHGGTVQRWKGPGDDHRLSINFMVYGHRMLWNKRVAADAAFLHVYYTPGEELAQLAALKARFGERVWLELKYMRSGYLRGLRGLPPDGALPAGLLALVPGTRELVAEAMAYCDAIGVGYTNPHTLFLEESGFFPDFGPIAAFKRQTDPQGLLNPGKIGERTLQQARRSAP